jgi:tetrahydromethanopterin S-methyltransferase subunit H
LFRFSKKQETYDIAGVRIGGQPGEVRTVLSGAIFYKNHPIVTDEKKGLFDKAKAEELIVKQEELSDRTGNPHFVQIFALTPEAMRNYIDFVAEITDAPFLIDSIDSGIRLEGVAHACEAGLSNRAIYNSIGVGIEDREIEKIRELKIEAAIILAFSPRGFDVKGRIYTLDNGDGILSKGLLQIAKECGITKPLIDVAVTLSGQGAGAAIRASYVAKAKWGYPVGGAIYNAAAFWEKLGDYEKEYREFCRVGANVIQRMAGGDFILYGPIEKAPKVFPLVAFTDEIMAEAAKDIKAEPS